MNTGPGQGAHGPSSLPNWWPADPRHTSSSTSDVVSTRLSRLYIMQTEHDMWIVITFSTQYIDSLASSTQLLLKVKNELRGCQNKKIFDEKFA